MTTPLEALSLHLANIGPAAVAVSGGVDSMTLGVLAHRVNPQIEIFHAISPAVPRQATERVQRYATAEQWRLNMIDAREVEDPDYLANPANRCYFCKTNLYDTIVQNTTSLVLSGTNLDDLDDYRPGLIAAKEHQVAHPYIDCGVSKPGLRMIAKTLKLEDLHDLPAAPCLSSRIETGIRISPSILPVINDVEQEVWSEFEKRLGIKNVRCRIRNQGVVLELTTIELVSDQVKTDLCTRVQRHFAGTQFEHLSENVSVEPYAQGSAFLKESLAIDVTPRSNLT